MIKVWSIWTVRDDSWYATTAYCWNFNFQGRTECWKFNTFWFKYYFECRLVLVKSISTSFTLFFCWMFSVSITPEWISFIFPLYDRTTAGSRTSTGRTCARCRRPSCPTSPAPPIPPTLTSMTLISGMFYVYLTNKKCMTNDLVFQWYDNVLREFFF